VVRRTEPCRDKGELLIELNGRKEIMLEKIIVEKSDFGPGWMIRLYYKDQISVHTYRSFLKEAISHITSEIKKEKGENKMEKESEFIKKWKKLQDKLYGLRSEDALDEIFKFIDKEVMQEIDKKLNK